MHPPTMLLFNRFTHPRLPLRRCFSVVPPGFGLCLGVASAMVAWVQGFVLLAHAGYEGQGSQVWNRKKELLPTYILQCLMKDTQLDWK